jgi:hypothetical protein
MAEAPVEDESSSRDGGVAATMEARQMTKLRLTRPARGAVIALALALVVAAPAAAATPPTRVVYGLDPFVLPAGTACAFDVEGQPSWGFIAVTTFSDGRELQSVRAHGAYVNMATGATFPTADTSRVLNQFDPATGIHVIVIDGQNSYSFLPGDMGPFGVVTNSNGAFYHIDGSVKLTWNQITNQITEFAYSGNVTDICAALS